MFTPFDNYSIQVDRDLEEVYVEAWDDSHPDDVFRVRLDLADIMGVLRRLSTGLVRW